MSTRTRYWPCPRCAAAPTSDCRTAAGTARFPHWRRWRLARSRAVVENWVAQSSDFERLLHTVDVAIAGGREGPAVPAEAVGGRLRALHNLRTLQEYIARWLTALDSEYADTAPLAAGARRTVEDLDAATSVLREILQGLPVDRDSLPADRAPTVAELVAARTRGDILAAESAFAQRLALAHDRSPVTTRWSVTTGANRAFEAVSEHGVRVRARAVLPAALEAELARWSCPPSPPEARYPAGRPVLLPAQLALTSEERDSAPSPWDFEHADLAHDDYGRDGQADLVAAALLRLREHLAPAEVPAFFAERCAVLNTTAAQLPDLLPDPDGLEEPYVLAGGYTWVDPASVVRTADPAAWGTIARDGERAGSAWIPNAIREWLACDDVPALLREAMTGSSPVQLRRLDGPTGPLYTSHMDGTHRLHLWRVLKLPGLYAWVESTALPRRLMPYAVCGNDAGRGTPEQVARIWEGLHDKGLLHGELTQPGEPFGMLELHAVPALWLLYPPALAAAYGRRYSEVYPGSWQRVGIPADAFTSEESWTAWSTG